MHTHSQKLHPRYGQNKRRILIIATIEKDSEGSSYLPQHVIKDGDINKVACHLFFLCESIAL
jgi:hypothetical protein